MATHGNMVLGVESLASSFSFLTLLSSVSFARAAVFLPFLRHRVIGYHATPITYSIFVGNFTNTPVLKVEVLKSNRTVGGKVLWCALVFLFPIGGMIIYYLFSNRTAHSSYEPIV